MKTLVLLLFFVECSSQSLKKILIFPQRTGMVERGKNYWINQSRIAGSSFASGFLDGETDFLYWNFENYQKVWKGTNPQWSNPRLSSDNKYKPGTKEPRFVILGMESDEELVIFTDKWHMNNFIEMALLSQAVGITVPLYYFKKGVRFKHVFWRAIGQGVIVHSFHSLGKAACFKFYSL